METIQVQDRVPLGRQVPLVPALEQRLQTRDDPRDRALRQVLSTQQRLERLANAPGVGTREVAPQDRLIDGLGPAGVARQQLAAKLGRPASLADPTTRDSNLARADLGGHQPALHTVAVAAPTFAALVALASEGLGELFLEHHLDGLLYPLPQPGLDVQVELDDSALTRSRLFPHGVP
ncbi:MAG TPA: hypothetical protein VD788_14335, partial [Candidatus Polarisedimenticolaceae bacterium]|nr:hypothetical protein [Candidatus Polarisedimenticolaceae bacterium]